MYSEPVMIKPGPVPVETGCLYTVKLCLIALLAGLCLVCARTGLAHDPGLSFAQVQLRDQTVRLHLSLAEKEIESLVAVDANRDGSISLAELESIYPVLEKRLAEGIDLRVDGESVSAVAVTIRPGPSETVMADMRYPGVATGQMSLAVPLLDRLTRGHRQHLTVLDGMDRPQLQRILHAGSDAVLLGNPGSAGTGIWSQYFVQGVWHIWAGFDHILFLVTLLLPVVLVSGNRQWQSIDRLVPALKDTFKIVTAFTLAHSVTLGLAVFDVIQLPARFVESVIAFSVLITAANNLRPVFTSSRWLLAWVFGLVHGFGFASVLTDLGIPEQSVLASLLGFNLGVEAGQIAIVMTLVPLAYLIRHTVFYRKCLVSGGSLATILLASVWLVERVSGSAFVEF